METHNLPTGHLGHTVKQLYHLMGQYFNDVLRPYGVAQSQWYMLYAIRYTPGITQKRLQKSLGVESATLTVALHSLERKGWIARHPHTGDKRINELVLTPAGEQLWQTLPDPIAAIRAKMLGGISQAEVAQVQVILAKAIKNFEQK